MGKGFEFGLEKLLEIRVEKEEESKRLFTQSQREKQVVEQKLADLRENYGKYNGIAPGESVVYQKLKKNYLFALNKGIDTTEKEVVLKEKEVNFRRDNLKKSQIDRKTVDILKEKQKLAYIKEQNRIEQIANDEFALYGYMRNHRKGVKS
ncbi:flagellar export protein FliJ [Clostridium chauvoei]|uniref:Flagellar FliJ protein n=2 Tax=Clostridium chauvoei TaxID=46867 RepID=S6EPR4_9CLOT|nr:flagellar export protein FliJ [Clostridium chauvoei]ATD54637.1 flagellar export protein FliJ [Clostridium chauvoei]ATD57681.1 flagellar export protein FliJ [Clostridium chauvoei]MBX7279930.1 flagellar export protein FliJ [Clostridium chauvoei]MBX7282411.1 flagellar export protein FliJ [Clostridium chauvoei]MBX7284821.1 flagellar export protein FliJ [Clostridium chauvoei]